MIDPTIRSSLYEPFLSGNEASPSNKKPNQISPEQQNGIDRISYWQKRRMDKVFYFHDKYQKASYSITKSYYKLRIWANYRRTDWPARPTFHKTTATAKKHLVNRLKPLDASPKSYAPIPNSENSSYSSISDNDESFFSKTTSPVVDGFVAHTEEYVPQEKTRWWNIFGS